MKGMQNSPELWQIVEKRLIECFRKLMYHTFQQKELEQRNARHLPQYFLARGKFSEC